MSQYLPFLETTNIPVMDHGEIQLAKFIADVTNQRRPHVLLSKTGSPFIIPK
jgi:hypothetical protein